ncbi:MAG: hypothetical protein IPK16_01510 [Anaerolineales bacterium]|nr:hypothetical protein [Anaerolineales bacterium]
MAEESFVKVAWRILTFRGKATATLTPAASIVPSPDDKPEQLAHDAQRAVEAVLGLAPAPTVLESLAMPEGLPNHHGT